MNLDWQGKNLDEVWKQWGTLMAFLVLVFANIILVLSKNCYFYLNLAHSMFFVFFRNKK